MIIRTVGTYIFELCTIFQCRRNNYGKIRAPDATSGVSREKVSDMDFTDEAVV